MELPQFSMVWSIIGLVIAVLWALLAFHLGQKRGKDVQFYLLVFIPVIVGVIAGIITSMVLSSTLGIVALIIFVIERIAWGVTLKEAAGEDKFVWFLIIWLIPLFGWLLYRATSIR